MDALTPWALLLRGMKCEAKRDLQENCESMALDFIRLMPPTHVLISCLPQPQVLSPLRPV